MIGANPHALAFENSELDANVSVNPKNVSRPGAAGEDELRQLFGLYGQTTGKGTVSRYLTLN